MCKDIIFCLFLFTVVLAIIDFARCIVGDYPWSILPVNILCALINYMCWKEAK